MNSFSQVHKSIKKNKQQLDSLFKQLEVQKLNKYEDLEQTHVKLSSIINLIPPKQRLRQILYSAPKNRAQQAIQNYSGQYQIIHKAKEKLKSIKSDAKSIYYLMAELHLPRQQQDFAEAIKKGVIELNSFEVKMNQKKNKLYKKDRNIIVDTYLTQLKQMEDNEMRNTPNVQEDQLLITVSFYDSIRQQKTDEYVFLGSDSLLKLKDKLECLIRDLQQKTNREQIKDIEKWAQIKESCLLIIEQTIFVHGNQKDYLQIDGIISSIESQTGQKYIRYEFKKTLFNDLRIIFGKPYLFRHIANCDHYIVFKYAKLYDPKVDISSKSRYPLQVFQGKIRKRKCEACQKNNATFATIADPLKNNHNLYLCFQCHQQIHNEQHSGPLYKTVPYIHD